MSRSEYIRSEGGVDMYRILYLENSTNDIEYHTLAGTYVGRITQSGSGRITLTPGGGFLGNGERHDLLVERLRKEDPKAFR